MTIRFCYDNVVDNVASTAITGMTGATGFPLSNLQTPLRGQKWRSTSLSSPYVQVDSGSSSTFFNYVAIVDATTTISGEYIVRLSNASDFSGTDIYYGEHDAYDLAIGTGTPHGLGGYVTNAEFDALSVKHVRIIYLGATYQARYFRVRISDATNPDGYVEIGRIYTGLYYEPGINIGYGVEAYPECMSTVTYSMSGQKAIDARSPRWVMEFDLPWLSEEDYWWGVAKMLAYCGKHKHLIVSLYPGETGGAELFGDRYGTFDGQWKISQPSYVFGAATGLRFIESI